ncbi:Xaa-Pro aminopeptidase [Inquilinus ginsengisoli]|uniref:Xaa-Pro aminopeptidase n=2 Tax=Inquilinus TaxID=171673 RepID=A0ABU1JI85_9PROT|nr:aminopeptidase P family protein [Inquilinus ginsengisoli]MDR6288042.1 Xaa-Pro aminopeptidase [Inquilinus ginsengisoli]
MTTDLHDALAAAAADTGGRYDASALQELLEGVVAAPAALDEAAWLELVAPDATEPQAKRLRAAKAAVAAARRPAGPQPAERLAALRAALGRLGLDGYVVPHADEHQGEYLPAQAERLAWLTGFTGSAGLAVVTADRAAIFIDGRYTIQAEQQTDAAQWERRHLHQDPHEAWLAGALPKGGKAGYDPRLATVAWVEKTRKAVEAAGGTLVAVEENPIDTLWTDQPPAPISPTIVQESDVAGQEARDKRAEIAEALRRDRLDAVVLTAPESVAWLLNLRGADVPHTPLPLSFAVLHADGLVDLFIDRRKLVPGVDRHLGNEVAIQPPSSLGQALEGLGRAGKAVRIDAASASAWVQDRLKGAKVDVGADPCALPRARKNATELEGTRAAHRRDGAAVTRFLAWLAREAPSGKLDEASAAAKLHDFRVAAGGLRDESFDTISAAGPNAALPHYRFSAESNRPIEPGNVYLVDSGGQYRDGTTDITRTIIVGTPTEEMRRAFTLVLKGHIAISTARVPKGTTGSQIDAFARRPLWQHGLDYDHGTGHGVGSYLSVHEGPARIAKTPNTIALEPGMILSNEPGYYAAGRFGIRTETLVVVQPCAELSDDSRSFLEFETITFAPIDLALVDAALLTAEERAWLDAYHIKVREIVGPQLDGEDRAWLDQATRPVA